MHSLRIPAAALLLAVVAGCSEQPLLTATAIDNLPAAYGVAGQSGCFTVEFRTALSPTAFPRFTGPVTGDLEGTVELTFDLPFVFRGVVGFGSGPVTWSITGGIIPDVPFTFRTTSSALTLFMNDNDPFLLETNDGHKVLDGVLKANFTGFGVTDVSGPQVTVLDYRGVICP